MKIEIPTKNSIRKFILNNLQPVYKEINKLKERIADLEEENKTLRFEK